MARLYANENFPLPVVIHETGKAGQAVPDTQIVAIATTKKRAVLTIDRKHSIKIHSLYSGGN